MKLSPFVSIIVPVYNTAPYLKLCLDSIFQQNYSNYEVILVDDGSTDNSLEICNTYAALYSFAVVIHKENGGLSSARNAGIRVAKGRFLTFVDSDDIIAPNMVSEMVRIAVAEHAEIVKIRLERKTESASCIPSTGGVQILQPTEALKQIYEGQPQIISACGKLFAAELFDNICFPDGRYYEDEYTTPKLYALANNIVFCESVLYFYMQWENGSIMRSPLTEKKIMDIIFVMEDRISFFLLIKNNELTNQAKIDYYLRLSNLSKDKQDIAISENAKRLLNKKKKTLFFDNAWRIIPVLLKQKIYRLVHILKKPRAAIDGTV